MRDVADITAVDETNRKAGFIGLGFAELSALLENEQSDSTVAMRELFDLTDDEFRHEQVLEVGRSGLVARGLYELDATGRTGAPVGFGAAAAYALAHPEIVISITTSSASQGADTLVLVGSDLVDLVIVPRLMLTFQLSTAADAQGRAELVWDVITRQLEAASDSSFIIAATGPDAETGETIVLTLADTAEHPRARSAEEGVFHLLMGVPGDADTAEFLVADEDEVDARIRELVGEADDTFDGEPSADADIDADLDETEANA